MDSDRLADFVVATLSFVNMHFPRDIGRVMFRFLVVVVSHLESYKEVLLFNIERICFGCPGVVLFEHVD